ncbi:MAG: hypothetical protein Q9209_000891 [Squamulea sp. 1 TL-2023]
MVLGRTSNGHAQLTHRHTTVRRRDPIDPPPSRHSTLTFYQRANVTRVLINNPPINLLTTSLISDLHDFLLWTKPSPGKITPKVVIFSSALPSFFISHFDLHNLDGSPSGQDSLTQLIACGRLLQNITSTAFIAEIDGRTYGGGQELASQMDMRFAGPNALVSQYENSNGFVAQAGGQLSLGPIIGKARAMEHLLASKSIDASTGAQLGLFNAHYPSQQVLTAEVDALAARIGLFPQSSLNDTKFTLSYMSPTAQQMDDQITRFSSIGGSEWSQAVLRQTLKASDETENAFEMGIPNSVVQALYKEQLEAMGEMGKRVMGVAEQDSW